MAAKLRDLPMVLVPKTYTFTGPNGEVTLSDLFAGRHQLIVYHFMLGPDDEEGCSGCSFLADHIPNLSHLKHRDTTFVVVSRAPFEKITAFKKRMGWTFPWYSSAGSDFNYDLHVTLDENVAPAMYNYRTKQEADAIGKRTPVKGDFPGLSVFLKEEDKEGERIFHTYSSYARGGEFLLTTYKLLDITPLGRQESSEKMGFLHHDKYDEE